MSCTVRTKIDVSGTWLVGFGGRPAVTERDGEGVQYRLPTYRPSGAAGPGRVQATGHKIQAFQRGLFAREMPARTARRGRAFNDSIALVEQITRLISTS